MKKSKIYGLIANCFNNKTNLVKTDNNKQVDFDFIKNSSDEQSQLTHVHTNNVTNSTFLQTCGCSFHLENIVREAVTDLYLVSPYLKVNDRLLDLLKTFNSVHIHIIYGKERTQQGLKSLKELNNCSIYYLKNLHAKCYLNENSALITSMNLYDFSQVNNIEFGLMVKKEVDLVTYQQIRDEVIRLIQIGEKVSPKENSKNSVKLKEDVKAKEDKKSDIPIYTQNEKSKVIGYCIRCKTEIGYNPLSPYCLECWKVWNQFGNQDFQEKHCHRCGEKNSSSMNKPQCYPCYDRGRM